MFAVISVSGANQIFQNFNWHTPSWDLFILLFWAVASIMYAFSAGRGRIISLLMSLYIAKLFVLQAPWLANTLNQTFPNALSSLQQLVSFLIIFVILFILLSRYAFRTSADGRHFTAIPFAIVFAFLQVGLLINTILGYLSVSGRTFSDLITLIFLSGPAGFVWLVAPLLFLVILGRAIADPNEI
jgi:hypothetical protein